jgi:hypothetical protein
VSIVLRIKIIYNLYYNKKKKGSITNMKTKEEFEKDKLYQEKVQEYCKEHNITERIYNMQRDGAPDLQHSPLAELYNPKYSREEIEAARDVIIDPRIEYERAREEYKEEHNLSHEEYKDLLYRSLEEKDISLMPASEALNPSRDEQEREMIERYQEYEKEVREYCKQHKIYEKDYEHQIQYTEKYEHLPSPELSNPLRESDNRAYHAHSELYALSDPRNEYDRAKIEYMRENNLSAKEYFEQVRDAQSIRDIPISEALNPSRSQEERIDIFVNTERDAKFVDKYNPFLSPEGRQEGRNDQMRETYGEHSRFNIRGRSEIEPNEKYETRVSEYCKDNGINREEYDKIVAEAKTIKDLPHSEFENPKRSDYERLQIYEDSTYRDRTIISPSFEYALRETYGLNPPAYNNAYAREMMNERNEYRQEVQRECRMANITREEYLKSIEDARYYSELRHPEYLNPLRKDNEREFVRSGRDDRYMAPESKIDLRMTEFKYLGNVEVERIHDRDRNEPNKDMDDRDRNEPNKDMDDRDRNEPNKDMDDRDKNEHDHEIDKLMQALYNKMVEKYCEEHSITKEEYEKEVTTAREEGHSLAGFYPEESNPALSKEERDILIDSRINGEKNDHDKDEHEHDKEHQHSGLDREALLNAPINRSEFMIDHANNKMSSIYILVHDEKMDRGIYMPYDVYRDEEKFEKAILEAREYILEQEKDKDEHDKEEHNKDEHNKGNPDR